MHVSHPWHGVRLWGATVSRISLSFSLSFAPTNSNLCEHHKPNTSYTNTPGTPNPLSHLRPCRCFRLQPHLWSVIHRNTPCGHAGSDLWTVLNTIKRAMPVCEAVGEQLQLCPVGPLRVGAGGTSCWFSLSSSHLISILSNTPTLTAAQPRLFKIITPLVRCGPWD